MDINLSAIVESLDKILKPPFLMSQNPIHGVFNIIKDPLCREFVTIPLTLEIPGPH